MPKLTLKQFLGPGGDMPTDSVAVLDDEAADVLAILVQQHFDAPAWRQGEFAVRVSTDTCSQVPTVGLFHNEALVGFYEGATLWIAPEHRRRHLSLPLILETVKSRGGVLHPNPNDWYGFSVYGRDAHIRAYEALMGAEQVTA